MHRPNLLTDSQGIVDAQSQTDPQFRTNRRYTRRSAAAVRRHLIVQTGYPAAQLPTAATIGATLTAVGYFPKTVAKTRPQKHAHKPPPSSSS